MDGQGKRPPRNGRAVEPNRALHPREADEAERERAALERRLNALRAELTAERHERWRIAMQAEEQAARLDQAVQLAQIGHYVWNLDEDRCESCSDKLAAAFGLAPEDFIARSRGPAGPHLLVHPEDREAFGTAFRGVPHGRHADVTYRTNNAVGPRRLREIARPVAGPDGHVARAFCTAVDVTGQQGETARQAEVLRMESLGRLAGGIAHDFNNLLAVVLGNLELLDDAPSQADRMAIVGEIAGATLRGRDLTRRMLGFARRGPQSPEATDLSVAVQEMGPLLRRTLPETIALDLAAEGALWPVMADRSLLDSALLNLAINARDAMPDGGTLSISARNRPGGAPAGDHVLLTVADTGTGIPPELQDKVFHPFFSTKEPSANSGLGLAMVQSFLHQAGGRIEVESHPGGGTRFHLYFRVAAGDGPARPRLFAPPPDETCLPAGTHILVVEDDPAVRRILALQLGRSGARVTEAADADEALAAFDAWGPFDLLVSDVVLPGELQGPAIAAHLRRRQPDLKVIYQSGYPHQAGAFDIDGHSDPVLLKPVNRRELLCAVQTALGT